MVYSLPIFLNFQTNISKCFILWISITNIIKMFVHDIPFSYLLNFQTNISKCLILCICQSQIFVSGISLVYLHSILPRAPAALGALLNLRTLVVTAFFAAPFTAVMCRSSVAATDRLPPDKVCPAQTATAIGSPRRRCFPSCPTRQLHLPAHVGTCSASADGAGVRLSELSCLGVTSTSRARAPAH